jgi:Histidine kinase
MPESLYPDIVPADSASLNAMTKRLLWRWGLVMLLCANVGSMAWVVAHLWEAGHERDAWVLGFVSCALCTWNLTFFPACMRARLDPHQDSQPSDALVAVILIGQIVLELGCRHYTHLEVSGGWKHWPAMVSAVYAVTLVRSRLWLITALVFPVVAMAGVDWLNGGWAYPISSGVATACAHMFVAVYSRLAVYAHGQAKQAVLMNEQLRAANQRIAEQADQTALLAVAQERNRMAQDIHDAVGHSITVVNAQLAAAATLLPD